MKAIIKIREPVEDDCNNFLNVMNKSINLHHPWTKPPLNNDEYSKFLSKSKTYNNKSFLILLDEKIAGVININEIVLGAFKSAFLGYYVNQDHSGQGVMSKGMRLVINFAFNELNLHRLEANIQPENINSIKLVKRLGFSKEGFSPKYLFIDGDWRDHERWAITVESWSEKQNN